MISNTVIDWEYLRSLRALQGPDEPDIVEELVQMFATEAEVRGARLQEGLRSGNADDIRRVAHMLRGSAGEIGAPVLAKLATELEAKAGAGQVDAEVTALVERVHGALQEASAVLLAGDNPA
jgi:HPt (histidine-containing phosphotransfer) domain-containing protein